MGWLITTVKYTGGSLTLSEGFTASGTGATRSSEDPSNDSKYPNILAYRLIMDLFCMERNML